MSATREFTENWLQALMLSATNEAARRIRPWMTDVGALSAVTYSDSQLESAKRVWEYGSRHGLTGLLSQSPLQQTPWRFEDDECFQFRRPDPGTLLTDEGSFLESLGVVPLRIPLHACVTSSDWTNLLRREAVRRSKPLNVLAIPAGSMIEIDCWGVWDTRTWSIAFAQPDWLVIDQPGQVQAPRPLQPTIDALLLEGIDFANRNFKVATKLSAFAPQEAPWMSCVHALYGWHRSLLLSNEMGASTWLRRVWNCVWPVIYRERNRLRGGCDLQALRKEVAECFEHAPLLAEWMFLFARLVCEVQFEHGLSIAGDFADA